MKIDLSKVLIEQRFARWFLQLNAVGKLVVVFAFFQAATWATEQYQAASDELVAYGWYVSLIISVVLTVLAELTRPTPKFEEARPAGLGSFVWPTATEGRVVPILFGTVKIKGPNVVWYGDLEQIALRERRATGLWSSTDITVAYKYFLGIQFCLCRGPGAAIRAVEINEEEVHSGTVAIDGETFDIDEPEILGGNQYGSGGIQVTMDFYGGSTTQDVNAYLNDPSRQQITEGTTNTAPRYIGTSYVVVRELTSTDPTADDSGGYVGNSTNMVPWNFTMSRYPALFDGQPATHNVINGDDCNPMNVMYELLTDKEWGFGKEESDIDVGDGSSFVNASTTLRDEGNGFAMLIDQALDADELKAEIERQIEGSVKQDPLTGKWTVQLVRGPDDPLWGYDIDEVPLLDDTNIIEVSDPTLGTWEDTTNQVQVKYDKRDDRYKESYAVAQNHAVAILLAGGDTETPQGSPSIMNFPGVKSSELASQIAFRELRGLSRPLLRAKLKINRASLDIKVGTVVAWTDLRSGRVKTPMRVTKVELGTAIDNTMTLTVAEDVFTFRSAAYGDPQPTDWVQPSTTLQAYPVGEQVVIEAPRGLITRDPLYGGDPTVVRIFASARKQTTEVGFQISERNANGTPTGDYSDVGDVVAFPLIGELESDLDVGSDYPLSTLSIVPDPDSQLSIEAVFDDATSLEDMGVDLIQLIMVDNEFMLVQSASINGSNVDFENVYRGVLDSAQEAHQAGASVFLLFEGAGISDSNISSTSTEADVKLLSRSSKTVLDEVLGTTINLDLEKRALRPYPPSAILVNGSSSVFGTPDLEGDGAGLNGVGFDVEIRRRNYDTTNEITHLLADAGTVDASLEHRIQVIVDPNGSPSTAYDSGWFTGTTPSAFPTQAELVTYGAAGTDIQIRVDSRHDFASETELESLFPLLFETTPTSARSSQFYLGGDLQASNATNVYTVASVAIHTVTIGAAYSSSDIEERINGGSWTVVISAGGTSAALNGGAALAVNDTIELRHTVNETPDPNFVEINDGSIDVAYGAFSS